MSDQAGLHELEIGTSCHVTTTQVYDEEKANNGPATAECEFLNTDFSSPLQVTPLFRSLAAEIPTPKFSESTVPPRRDSTQTRVRAHANNHNQAPQQPLAPVAPVDQPQPQDKNIMSPMLNSEMQFSCWSKLLLLKSTSRE